MKSIFALCFIVFSLLSFANLSYARKSQGDYWKNMMKGKAMPEAIKDLLLQDPPSSVADAGKKDRFVRDFDVRPNVIIYHTHVVSEKKKKPLVNNFEPGDNMKLKEQEAMVEQTGKKG